MNTAGVLTNCFRRASELVSLLMYVLSRCYRVRTLLGSVRLFVGLLIWPNRPDAWVRWAQLTQKLRLIGWTEAAYRRAISLAPQRSLYHTHFAYFLIGQKQLLAAEQSLITALACSEYVQHPEDVAYVQQVLTCLGAEKHEAGEIDKAYEHWGIAIAQDRQNLSVYHAIWMILISKGEFERGSSYFQQMREVQATQRARSKATRYLRDMWSYQIGHLSHLDAYFKIGLLGWRPEQETVLLAPHHRISNPAFLNLWKPYLTVVSDPRTIASLEHEANLQEDYLPMLEIKGKSKWLPLGSSIVQMEWESQRRHNLLKLDDDTLNRGWETLKRLGVPSGAWFVGLHVRDARYYRCRDDSVQASRNGDVRTYLKAIDAITRRGGWVILMGGPTAAPLPAVQGLVDYAHSSVYSDWMDIFLCAQSRFFLGTQSGLSFVPNVFGVPTVYTNWVSLATPPWYSIDLFIPKLLHSRHDNRYLRFAEIMSTSLGHTQLSSDFARHGVTWIDNSPEDICKVTEEMMTRLDGPHSSSCVLRQNDLVDLAATFNVVLNSQIGQHFLEDHPYLLDDCDAAANCTFKSPHLMASLSSTRQRVHRHL